MTFVFLVRFMFDLSLVCRFLLLPALLGYFSVKQTLVDPSKGDVSAFRQECIKKSQVGNLACFIHFDLSGKYHFDHTHFKNLIFC